MLHEGGGQYGIHDCLEARRAAGVSHVPVAGPASRLRSVYLAKSRLPTLSSASRLAYGSLHEASTALFPSGCPLCRHHLLRQRTPEAGSSGVNEAALTPPPHCDICELSARVVMRGVGLMERDKDYDSAFHYLEILLQVRFSAVELMSAVLFCVCGVIGAGFSCIFSTWMGAFDGVRKTEEDVYGGIEVVVIKPRGATMIVPFDAAPKQCPDAAPRLLLERKRVMQAACRATPGECRAPKNMQPQRSCALCTLHSSRTLVVSSFFRVSTPGPPDVAAR